MNTWQPISTAPKDGTRVLIMWWNNPDSHEVLFWDERRTIWCASDGGWGSDRFKESDFMVWMPLPKAPEMAA